MLRARRIFTHLRHWFALIACLALLAAPAAGFAPGRIIEEHEESTTERSETVTAVLVAATNLRPERAPLFERRHARSRKQPPASRHVPAAVSAHAPQPTPCWTRPLRC